MRPETAREAGEVSGNAIIHELIRLLGAYGRYVVEPLLVRCIWGRLKYSLQGSKRTWPVFSLTQPKNDFQKPRESRPFSDWIQVDPIRRYTEGFEKDELMYERTEKGPKVIT